MSRHTTTKPAAANASRSFGNFIDPVEATIPQTTPETPRLAADPAEAAIAWAHEFKVKQAEGRTFTAIRTCSNCDAFGARRGVSLNDDSPPRTKVSPDGYCTMHATPEEVARKIEATRAHLARQGIRIASNEPAGHAATATPQTFSEALRLAADLAEEAEETAAMPAIERNRRGGQA